MCTIYWEFICFVLFFGQISIRVHCICFFFLQKLQHDFPKYQGLCSFSCLVFVCLPLFCYLINQSSYVIIKVEITRLLLLFNFNGICLITTGYTPEKLMVKKYTWSLAVVLKSCTD